MSATSELSPDGRFRLEVQSSTDNSGGTGGMGHDADDYWTHTVTARVLDVATGRLTFHYDWRQDCNANDQSSIGRVPRTVTFSADSRSLIANFASGEETLPFATGPR